MEDIPSGLRLCDRPRLICRPSLGLHQKRRGFEVVRASHLGTALSLTANKAAVILLASSVAMYILSIYIIYIILYYIILYYIYYIILYYILLYYILLYFIILYYIILYYIIVYYSVVYILCMYGLYCMRVQSKNELGEPDSWTSLDTTNGIADGNNSYEKRDFPWGAPSPRGPRAPGHMAGWQYFVWDNLGRKTRSRWTWWYLVDFKGRTWRLCGTEISEGQGGIWMIWMIWMT